MRKQLSKKIVIIFMIVATFLISSAVTTGAASKATLKTAAKPGPYSGVVLVGSTNVVFMSPYGFMSDKGTKDKNNFFWTWNTYDDMTPDSRAGCKYFTVTIKNRTDKYKRAVFDAATKSGAMPYIIGTTHANYDTPPKGSAKNIPVEKGVPYFPATCTKIYFDNWVWDESGKESNSPGTPAWISSTVIPDLQACITKVLKKSPKAQIYIGGCQPYAKSFPRHDMVLWPQNGFNQTDWKIPIPTVQANFAPDKLKAMDTVLQKWCTSKKYHFIDFYKSSFVDSNGYAKEDYMTPRSHGGVLGQAGLYVYGDYIMSQMGLPKPKR